MTTHRCSMEHTGTQHGTNMLNIQKPKVGDVMVDDGKPPGHSIPLPRRGYLAALFGGYMPILHM